MEGVITSLYGNRINPVLGTKLSHEGIDIYNVIGTDVVAVADGVVVEVLQSKTYGKSLKYKLDLNGVEVEVFYAHLNEILVKVGESVKQGDVVGKCGATGMVTGPHLHYELLLKGENINPIKYIDLGYSDEIKNKLENN